MFPWTHSQWQQLIQRHQDGRLPHALLLNGLEGLGKLAFARQFAMSMLCHAPKEGHACGQCRSCVQFEAGSHPDYFQLSPEEVGKAIKIGQVRELIGELSLASHYQSYRVAILHPAEAMNAAAANSLLKSLEEPPQRTLIMLVTSNRSALPATILSRCQRVDFAIPSTDMALNWLNKQQITGTDGNSEAIKPCLAMANGAPLKAIDLMDPANLSLRDEVFVFFLGLALQHQTSFDALGSNALKSDLTMPIQWIYSWVSDLIKLKSGYTSAIINLDKLPDLQKLAQTVEWQGLFTFMDRLVEVLRLQQAPLNKQMVIDDLFLHWQSVTIQAKPRRQAG